MEAKSSFNLARTSTQVNNRSVIRIEDVPDPKACVQEALSNMIEKMTTATDQTRENITLVDAATICEA